MNDDLVSGHIDWLRSDHEYCNPILADCIEQLEAKLAKQENIIAAGKEMYETAMLTGGGSPVAWTAYVKARNTFGDILAELKGETK